MNIPFYQVDAFASRPFTGNPAAVMPLDEWLPDETLQQIAAENNLAETAFFVPASGASDYHLRWFTPAIEVDLCGHATLASAAVIFRHIRPGLDRVRFDSLSGPLAVTRDGDLLELDFPARPATTVPVTPGITGAVGVIPQDAFTAGRGLHVVLDSAEAVRAFTPDFAEIARLSEDMVAITAPGDGEFDYVCRMFAPNAGIPEDPVTGSLQCALAPYWAERLGKTALRGYQASPRGGDLRVRLVGDRVFIAGTAIFVIEGAFTVSGVTATV